MTSRKIQKVDLPDNECDVDGCPQYCRQWSVCGCPDGMFCGLCKFGPDFMKQDSCYECVKKGKRR